MSMRLRRDPLVASYSLTWATPRDGFPFLLSRHQAQNCGARCCLHKGHMTAHASNTPTAKG